MTELGSYGGAGTATAIYGGAMMDLGELEEPWALLLKYRFTLYTTILSL